MIKFYETVVKYDAISDTGEPVKVQQQFLIDAMSCTEAEARTIKEVADLVKGQSEVSSVKVSKYLELIPENPLLNMKVFGGNNVQVDLDEDKQERKYYGVKISYIQVNDNGKTKRVPFHYITPATGVSQVQKAVFLHMKGSMADWEINNIVETKIIDVILTDAPL